MNFIRKIKSAIYLRKVIHTVLEKSQVDQFDYALKLITGERIRFSYATKHGDWLFLGEARYDRGVDKDTISWQNSSEGDFPRGLDVRISSIVWMADAPYGS